MLAHGVAHQRAQFASELGGNTVGTVKSFRHVVGGRDLGLVISDSTQQQQQPSDVLVTGDW